MAVDPEAEVRKWNDPNKPTTTITRRQLDLIQLRDRAATLMDVLPSNAIQLRQAISWLDDCREFKFVGP
jgi:hypothetical protein